MTGQKVAWKMFDGNVMAGEVICKGCPFCGVEMNEQRLCVNPRCWVDSNPKPVVSPGVQKYDVKRVDGGTCTVDVVKTWPATPEDILKACSFFSRGCQ